MIYEKYCKPENNIMLYLDHCLKTVNLCINIHRNNFCYIMPQCVPDYYFKASVKQFMIIIIIITEINMITSVSEIHIIIQYTDIKPLQNKMGICKENIYSLVTNKYHNEISY